MSVTLTPAVAAPAAKAGLHQSSARRLQGIPYTAHPVACAVGNRLLTIGYAEGLTLGR
jgi:adenosylmethionine-8-amino-7-oxononanoate aminotransferase